MRRRGPVVVVGDSFLDIDIDGAATRLSPDAPVPVVDSHRQWQRPGGAALAALLAALNAAPEVILVTAVGRDPAAAVLLDLLEPHVDLRPLPLEGDTVCKTRVRASAVPMLRLDSGTGRAAEVAPPTEVLEAISRAGTILVSDYGRGVTSLVPLREALSAAARRAPVLWDPHPRGAPPIPGCALVTPNAAEAAHFGDSRDPAEQGRRLCERWRARAVAVTLGERGAVLTTADPARTTDVPLPRELVAASPLSDTCGAGDSFASAVATTVAEGSDVLPAVQQAVRAAATFVQTGGASSVSTGVTASRSVAGEARRARPDAFEFAARVRRSGGRLVATGGCFDLLHRGHVQLLEQARLLGDALVVCLNSDASVRRAKGPGRPVVSEHDRAAVLLGLASVDAVAIFDERTPVQILSRLQPDVWVKGADYAGQPLPEAELVRSFGGQVRLLPVLPGYSTTRLVEHVRPDSGTTGSYPAVRSSLPQAAVQASVP